MQIVLIRHGKPDAAVNPRLTASGFAQWVRKLNKSIVRMDSVPPADLAAGHEPLPQQAASAAGLAGRSAAVGAILGRGAVREGGGAARQCSSLTCSIHSTALPSSRS